MDNLLGLLETGATLGSGALSGLLGMPYGLYKGVTSGAYGTPLANRIAEEEARKFIERNTYIPRTQAGQENLQAIAGLLEKSKLPPVMPEISLLGQIPRQAYAAQAERAGMAAERALEPVVQRTLERGGKGAQLLQDLGQGSVSPMDVWHGSPHGPFTKFDATKVGSGEGGSMYGVGTNLAESPSFAQGYRELLSGDEAFVTVDGAKDASDIAKMIGSTYKGDAEKAVKALESKIPSLEKKVQSASKEELLPGLSDFDMADMELQAQLRKVDEAKSYIGKDVKLEKPGYLYKVDLPDEAIEKMVNLDKPMKEQPKNVKEYFAKVIGRDFDNDAGWSTMSGSRALEAVRDRLNLYKGDFEKELYKQGIPGAQYINDTSGMAQGSSNFVVYPGGEDLLTIKSINDKPVGGLLEAAEPKAAQSLLDTSYKGSHTAPNASVYGATLDNLTKIMPADVYSQEGKRLYGIGDRLIDSEWRTAALKAKGKPDAEIEIYRAVPKSVKSINNGDWVTTSPTYAKWHGENVLDGEYEIVKQKVKAKTLSTEGYPYEFGYNELD